MVENKAGTVESYDTFWKLTLVDDDKEHFLTKVIDNEKKPGIKTKINIDVDGEGEGRKIKTSVSEVYYPKQMYHISDIEKVSSKILDKNEDVDCPMCEKIRAALEVDGIARLEDVLNLPRIDDMFPKVTEMFEPLIDTHTSIMEAIVETIRELVPNK